MRVDFSGFSLSFSINRAQLKRLSYWTETYALRVILGIAVIASIVAFIAYYKDGLGLSYNDARSHLDIGRRVVEGLKPGFAQLGSVWLPLPHLLMTPTIWNNFFWHTGLSGALESMISFVLVSYLIYMFLKELGVGVFGRVVGVAIFIANLNVLYLQSTAMTELLSLATMTAGMYEFLLWYKKDNIIHLVKAAFFIMLATLSRYDAWFLFIFMVGLLLLQTFRKRGRKAAEGITILFCTLGGFGIVLWFVWNQLIFHNALYFAFGPYSAHAQQSQLASAGVLATKGNMLLSLRIYLYAMLYNSGAFTTIVSAIGAGVLYFDKKLSSTVRIATLTLIAPLLFNIIALYFGHSVLFIQGISGNTWFNVRYGVMMMPSIAIFIGYLIERSHGTKYILAGLLCFVVFFSFLGHDAVTIDDATIGASQKNVKEVSGWLRENTANTDGFVLISAASHDAIIFSSGLPMKKFIHEGTGQYWDNAVKDPSHWARWIIMRTHDQNDLTFRTIKSTNWQSRYRLVHAFPFADIYELKPQYLSGLETDEVFAKQ